MKLRGYEVAPCPICGRCPKMIEGTYNPNERDRLISYALHCKHGTFRGKGHLIASEYVNDYQAVDDWNRRCEVWKRTQRWYT